MFKILYYYINPYIERKRSDLIRNSFKTFTLLYKTEVSLGD